MSIQDLPTDIIITICQEVVHEDVKISTLEKLKKSVLKSIIAFNVKWNNEAIPSGFGEEVDSDIYDDKLEYFIITDIKNLSQKEKDAIICDYGMVKAMKLFQSFLIKGCGDSPEDFCEYLDYSSEIAIQEDMILYIIKDEINFRNDWSNK